MLQCVCIFKTAATDCRMFPALRAVVVDIQIILKKAFYLQIVYISHFSCKKNNTKIASTEYIQQQLKSETLHDLFPFAPIIPVKNSVHLHVGKTLLGVDIKMRGLCQTSIFLKLLYCIEISDKLFLWFKNKNLGVSGEHRKIRLF